MIFVIQPDLFQWLCWHVHIVKLPRNTSMKVPGGGYMVGGRVVVKFYAVSQIQIISS